MNLLYTLLPEQKALLKLKDGETIYYCAPLDLPRDDGPVLKNSWLAVTPERIITLEEGKKVFDLPLAECEDIKCEVQVGCGFFYAVLRGEDHLLGRFSMHNIIRFSYIARGARLLKQGNTRQVVSTERELFCPRCGRGMPPGTAQCPKCTGKMLTISRFMQLIKPYKLQMVFVTLFLLLVAVFTLALPEVQKRFIDGVLLSGTGTMKDVGVFIAVVLLLTALLIVGNTLKSWWCMSLGAHMSMNLRSKLYHKLQELSLSFINRRKPGELINRMSSDTREVNRFMEDVFRDMMTTIVTMAGATIMMLTLDWKMTLLALVFLPLSLSISFVFRKNTRRRFHKQWVKNDLLASGLQDAISGIRVVKSYGREQTETEKFDKLNREFADTQVKNEVFWAIFFPTLVFVMGLGIYFVTTVGGISVLEGRFTVGELTQFIAYVWMLYGPLGWMTTLPRRLMRLVNSLDRIFDVLDEQPDLSDTKNARAMQVKGDLEFRDVSFGYESYDPVLEHVSFTARQGEMIGLVGPSGAGKSTLINLIMHLYDPDDGQILLDGVDLREIQTESLHSQIGVVLQETFLFSGTIYNNIRFAKPNASPEEVIRAAKMANAHDFICKLPDGYNTYVGEKGYNLSGGERQRISIARAILNDPRLLILDEATASLDTESEYLIQQALQRLTAGRTTFAIAHRLSTLREADRLMVIDRKGIVESGTHNELLEKKGMYYGLVNAQLQMHTVKEVDQEKISMDKV